MKYTLFIALLVAYWGCNRELPDDTVAKVNDNYLYESDVSDLDSTQKYEFLKDWIELEMLYNEAKKNEIIDKRLERDIELNKKRIVKNYLINKITSKFSIDPKLNELKSYYANNQNLFAVNNDSYLIGLVEFEDFESANRFYQLVMMHGWDFSVNFAEKENRYIELIKSQLFTYYQISDNLTLQIIENMNENEVSIIIQVNEYKYRIVKLFRVFSRGSVPEFEIVKDKVEKLYVKEKQQILLENYIKSLYSKYDIEIRENL